MAAKFVFVFVCALALIQTLDAGFVKKTRSIEEDYEKATKPIHEAFTAVRTQMNSLVEKIQANPLYQRASATVNEGYTKAKTSITQTYDKLQACKKIIEEHH